MVKLKSILNEIKLIGNNKLPLETVKRNLLQYSLSTTEEDDEDEYIKYIRESINSIKNKEDLINYIDGEGSGIGPSDIRDMLRLLITITII